MFRDWTQRSQNDYPGEEQASTSWTTSNIDNNIAWVLKFDSEISFKLEDFVVAENNAQAKHQRIIVAFCIMVTTTEGW